MAVVFLLLAAPFATAAAQPSEKVPRVGFFGATARSHAVPDLDAFRQRLQQLGWVEGKNLVIEFRWAEGRPDRLPDLAAELVRLPVDVILVTTVAVAVAAKNATGTVPIVVATGGDPVALGLVASLARPGGNVTGLAYTASLEIVGKGLELLKEAVPTVRRVAVLSNPADPGHGSMIDKVKVAARSLGVELHLLRHGT
jgi:putative ABC transport system substrate-binding protein